MPEDLSPKGRYIVTSNHQSWTDIIVIQKLFNRKIPFFRFFLKEQLLFVPVLGLAWWALDYPFMKRYSRDTITKKPHLKGRDMEITRRACEKFRTMPFSIVIFLEGTRFTVKKHTKQNSPYNNLLKPKAGGISYVLYALGHQVDKILDLTIVYPEGDPTFWKFLTGRLQKAKVLIHEIDVTEDLIGNYSANNDFRKQFQQWVNNLWKEKDRNIADTV